MDTTFIQHIPEAQGDEPRPYFYEGKCTLQSIQRRNGILAIRIVLGLQRCGCWEVCDG